MVVIRTLDMSQQQQNSIDMMAITSFMFIILPMDTCVTNMYIQVNGGGKIHVLIFYSTFVLYYPLIIFSLDQNNQNISHVHTFNP